MSLCSYFINSFVNFHLRINAAGWDDTFILCSKMQIKIFEKKKKEKEIAMNVGSVLLPLQKKPTTDQSSWFVWIQNKHIEAMNG